MRRKHILQKLEINAFRLFVLFFSLFWASIAFGLDTPIFMGGTSVPSTSATQYTAANIISQSWDATETNQRSIFPVGGTLGSLNVKLQVAPGAGKATRSPM